MTEFTVSDTTGRASSTFRYGQPFMLSFSLINNTGRMLTDHYPPMPPVRFKILRGDSVVVTSTPKQTGPVIAVPNVIIEAIFLDPHDTVEARWKAPDTPYENSGIVLPGGNYTAQVSIEHIWRI